MGTLAASEKGRSFQFFSQWIPVIDPAQCGEKLEHTISVFLLFVCLILYTYNIYIHILNVLRNSWANVSAEVKLTHADVQSTNIQDYWPARSVRFGMKFEVIKMVGLPKPCSSIFRQLKSSCSESVFKNIYRWSVFFNMVFQWMVINQWISNVL